MDDKEKAILRYHAAEVFNPNAPIDQYALFGGRQSQIMQLFRTVGQIGEHAIIYGDRGVGKTSLANILREVLSELGIKKVTAVKVNAEIQDSFESLWQRIFRELLTNYEPASKTEAEQEEITNLPQAQLSPDDVRYFLQRFPESTIIIIDELDRLLDRHTTARIADTIKTLSDHSLRATLVLVGVAGSVEEIIADHKSIERALVQIHMPLMSMVELSEILDKGLGKLKMTIQDGAKHQIAKLSQGLPYYTHALALHASEHAIDNDRTEINMDDVHHAIGEIVGKRGHSNLQNYLKATRSSHKDSLYERVLLACAFSDADELGYFSASDVREPLSRIMKKQYEIPAYARHLNQFCEEAKGQILKKEKVGTSKRFKYRFTDPQMRPFVTLNGLAKHLIDIETSRELSGMN